MIYFRNEPAFSLTAPAEYAATIPGKPITESAIIMNANSPSYSVPGLQRHSVTKSQNINSQGPSLREVKSSDEVLAQSRRGPSHGRQFTVANVGNNGRLYLRYVDLSLSLVEELSDSGIHSLTLSTNI